jgi:hypothetical protein
MEFVARYQTANPIECIRAKAGAFLPHGVGFEFGRDGAE